MSLLTDLISYWRMDETGTGSTRVDSHGSNDLTSGGIIGLQSGTGIINDGGRYVSILTNYLVHADDPTLNPGDNDFTFSCWVKFDTTPSGNGLTIISKYDVLVGGQLSYTLAWEDAPAHMGWYVSSDGGVGGRSVAQWSGVPSTGVWYHIVVWNDSNNNEIGIVVNDGTPVVAAHSGGAYVNSVPFYLGSLNEYTGYFMNGLIDEVGYWHRVLTPTERTALYNGGTGFAYPFSAGGGAGGGWYYRAQQRVRTELNTWKKKGELWLPEYAF